MSHRAKLFLLFSLSLCLLLGVAVLPLLQTNRELVQEQDRDFLLYRLEQVSRHIDERGGLPDVLKENQFGIFYLDGRRIIPPSFPDLEVPLPDPNTSAFAGPCRVRGTKQVRTCAFQPLPEGSGYLVGLSPARGFPWNRILLLVLGAFGLAGALAFSFSRSTERFETQKRESLKLFHTERLATLGQLGASIAHEIKNPLMAIQGFAKMLSQELVDRPPQKEKAELILKESERSNAILTQLLRFAQPDRDGSRTYSLREVVDSVILIGSLEAKSRRVKLETVFSEGIVCQGNPSHTQQILLNLVINAIQVSPPQALVTIRAFKPETSSALIEVQDQGPGIPKEIQPRIFEPFFTTKAEGVGTGIGLWLSADLAQQEGGFLSFLSTPGEGSRFRLQLPCLDPSKSS